MLALSIILFLTSVIIALSAAYFSVTGLALMFAGAYYESLIMAGSLEFGKLAAVCYLHVRWKIAPLFRKSYMVSAVVVLMIITSMGIFGFLSSASQRTTAVLEKDINKLSLFKGQLEAKVEDKNRLISEKDQLQQGLKQELDGLIFSDSTRYYDALQRKRAMDRYKPDIDKKNQQVDSLDVKISVLNDSIFHYETKLLETGVDVGPLVFVSELLNVDMKTTNKIYIGIIMMVFDPFAIVLLLGSLDLFEDWKRKRDENQETVENSDFQNDTEPDDEQVVEKTPAPDNPDVPENVDNENSEDFEKTIEEIFSSEKQQQLPKKTITHVGGGITEA